MHFPKALIAVCAARLNKPTSGRLRTPASENDDRLHLLPVYTIGVCWVSQELLVRMCTASVGCSQELHVRMYQVPM